MHIFYRSKQLSYFLRSKVWTEEPNEDGKRGDVPCKITQESCVNTVAYVCDISKRINNSAVITEQLDRQEGEWEWQEKIPGETLSCQAPLFKKHCTKFEATMQHEPGMWERGAWELLRSWATAPFVFRKAQKWWNNCKKLCHPLFKWPLKGCHGHTSCVVYKLALLNCSNCS